MTPLPRCDLHIHTRHVRCANETMAVDAIVRECERLGVTALAITDHLNTLEQLDLHRLIREDIERLDPAAAVYFGVELNFSGPDGDFVFSPEIKERYGFQFAIGGIHGTKLDTYDLAKIVEVQHRHHLRTCRDPRVDVLVHPYWFGKGEFDRKGWPWFDTMSAVPESYARELGQAARETGTAIEINASAILANPAYSPRFVEEYQGFLSVLIGEGALFTLASDAHDIGKLARIEQAWALAAELGLTPDRIWMPPGLPLRGGPHAPPRA